MLFTLVVQLTIMRRFEKFLGWFRIIVIYTVCGMAANVFSGIFLPYFVTVTFTLFIRYMLAPKCPMWGTFRTAVCLSDRSVRVCKARGK